MCKLGFTKVKDIRSNEDVKSLYKEEQNVTNWKGIDLKV